MPYIIYEYIISFTLAFIIAFSTTPIAKKLAFRFGAIDVPRGERHIHKKPIARFGGLAIITAFLFTLLFNLVTSLFNEYSLIRLNMQLMAFAAGILLLTLMGVLDDIRQLRAKYKLAFQVAAALLVVLTGNRIERVTNPFSPTGMTELNPVFSFILTMFWIVGITNAINFIDGLDGLAAGVSSIASLSLFFVSVITGDMYSALITAMLAGATLGFLPYNFNPAKIFMADTGSNFLGFALGVISIQGTMKSYAAISLAIPVLVLGLPLFDTTFAILRRLINHKPIMEADRGHLHHRLMDMGLNQKQSVSAMYVASAALGLAAIVLADKGALSAIILVIAVSICIIAGARFMNEVSSDPAEESPTPEADSQSVDTTTDPASLGDTK